MGQVKSRQVFVILFFIGVLGTALYLWAFLRPARVTIETMQQDVVARRATIDENRRQANARIAMYEHAAAELEVLAELEREERTALPPIFDDTAVLRHIYDVVYPHTNPANPTINISFGNSQARPGDDLWSTTIELSFETSYWQFLSILHNLVEGDPDRDILERDLGNRVVEYNFNVRPMTREEFGGMLMQESPLGYAWSEIPVHIRNEFHADFLAGRDIMGLYMLNVNMRIEYLTLEPGILPRDVLRRQWVAEDAAAAEAAAQPEPEVVTEEPAE